jgi:NAD+ synthase
MEELARKLISWIGEQVKAADAKGVVVGTSGGLDSSVVAVLCKRALPQNTLGVLMPCYSSEIDLSHARLVAQKFDIATTTVTLDPVFDAVKKALPSAGFDAETEKLAQANLKPRLRMLTLYYLANRLGYLVVGSGNRSELEVGYFTKHGDGGVDILPLGNLLKSQVRELASYLGIPEEIISKPPSGGLWPGQTDEGELGISYEELDRYLMSGKASAEVKQRIEALSRSSSHKLRPAPSPPNPPRHSCSPG